MSQVFLEKDKVRARRGSASEKLAATVAGRIRGGDAASRVLVLHPCEEARISVRIHGPSGHLVSARVAGLPENVAHCHVEPPRAVAPHKIVIAIRVLASAAPGVYPFDIVVLDETTSRPLGQEPMTLVVVPRGLPKSVASRLKEARRLYKKYGGQATLWYLVKNILPGGATFTQLKQLYHLVRGKPVSNGTVGELLQRMLRKQILVEKAPGLYTAGPSSLEIVLSRIDTSRVRVGATTQQKREKKAPGTISSLPTPIWRAWSNALQIAQTHGSLVALWYLAYTLLGVRATGYPLLWLSEWFVICENKTGFCHHFYSTRLHEIMESLGLREGVLVADTEGHLWARRQAQKLIREHYGSHQAARRLHYMLKQHGLIEYDDEVFTLKIYHYRDNSIGVEIYDATGRELLHTENVKEDEHPVIVELRTALPTEHTDEENEETYFHRPAGLY